MNGSFNPYALNQEIKKGQATLIAQAWSQHEADRVRVSKSPAQMREILEALHEQEMNNYMLEEPFVQVIDFSFGGRACEKSVPVQEVELSEKVKPPDKQMPLVTEVYTTAQNVMKEAMKAGHRVGTAMSLENGWNFLDPSHREKARLLVRKEKPFCLVLAFPCGPFSPLQHLNPLGQATLDERQANGRILMNFAIELAEEQLAAGRHCLLENPLPSLAWKTPEMKKFLEENEMFAAVFDQCRFNLRSQSGALHKKPTKVVSSSSRVHALLDDVRCKRNHEHMPVIGGSKITAHAGIYPKQLARAIVRGLMDQFEADFRPKEALVADAGLDEDDGVDFAGHETVGAPPEVCSDEDEEPSDEKKVSISAGLKQTIKRLHENTGHRSPLRLARALAIAGAPSEAIAAAKAHRCDICAERAPAKARRPASLPVPKDMGDQVHVDLIEVFDAAETRFYVAHATDFATRFQAAEVLDDKHTKSVVRFLTTRWLSTFGAPRVLVCDQGREFVSWEMEEWASSVSMLLHHIAVQAPWQNGVAERSGGILKTILNAVIASNRVMGKDELQMALAEAVAAYNGDINESGASRFQAAIGRQPRMIGDVLGGVEARLAEHGLLDSKPSLARQIAMREIARVAMCRLHFSRGLRRAELARSRNSTLEQVPTPGTICYFYRPLRYNNRTSPSKKKLTLKRWHGPALLVAVEGSSSAFLSYKGQLTKCALEHVRVASSLEQISAGAWKDAIEIEEALESALHDITLRGAPGQVRALNPEVGERAVGDIGQPSTPGPPTPGFLPSAMPSTPAVVPGDDLPPLGPGEFLSAVQNSASLPSVVGSTLPSRRVSDVGGGSLGQGVPSVSSRLLGAQIDRARLMDAAAGVKRAAEVGTEELRAPDDAVRERGHEGLVSEVCHDVLALSKDQVIKSLGDPSLHPLVHVYNQACLDRSDPLSCRIDDHGSWDGRWCLPSRTEWHVRTRLGLAWPTGAQDQQDHETLAAQTAHKEFTWRQMTAEEKVEFRKAAAQAWDVWDENDAVEVLSPEESDRVRQRLRMNQEYGKILTPRFVFTDKHSGLRTAQNPLLLKARARIFIWTAAHNKLKKPVKEVWRLMSADVKSAFLKGDPFMKSDRELFMSNIKDAHDAPQLPFGDCLARIRKGVFGLSDAPRMWYLRLNRALCEIGWERSPMDFACWMLWNKDRTALDGIIVSHVDDLLLGGNARAQKLLLSLGEELGFGSVEYDDFTYCGKRIRQRPEDGTIVISMVEYHQNLRPVTIPVHRRECPDATLTEGERKQLRAVLGSLQWLVGQLRIDMGYHLSTLQGEPPLVKTLMKANALLKKFKLHSNFELCFRGMDLENCGVMVVTDASLGNVTRSGGAEGSVTEKVFSQSSLLRACW